MTEVMIATIKTSFKNKGLFRFYQTWAHMYGTFSVEVFRRVTTYVVGSN
jgi:hypothetical protein